MHRDPRGVELAEVGQCGLHLLLRRSRRRPRTRRRRRVNGRRSCTAAASSRGSPRDQPGPAGLRAGITGGGGERVRADVGHLPGARGARDVDQLVADGDHRHPRAAGAPAPCPGRRRRACRPGPARARRRGARRRPRAARPRPTRRTNAADGTPRVTVSLAAPPSVWPTGTTASASVGSGAPAATTRTACPGCRRSGWRDPAGISPTTGSTTGVCLARSGRDRRCGRRSRRSPPGRTPAAAGRRSPPRRCAGRAPRRSAPAPVRVGRPRTGSGRAARRPTAPALHPLRRLPADDAPAPSPPLVASGRPCSTARPVWGGAYRRQ